MKDFPSNSIRPEIYDADNKNGTDKPESISIKEKKCNRDAINCNKHIGDNIGNCFNVDNHKELLNVKCYQFKQGLAHPNTHKIFDILQNTLYMVFALIFFASAFLFQYHCLIFDGIAAIILLTIICLVFKVIGDPIEASSILGIILITWLVAVLVLSSQPVIFPFK
jgi:hypothetical protein